VRRNGFHFLITTLAAAAFVAAIAYPAAALVVECVRAGGAPKGDFEIGERVGGLLWRSLWLSCAAVAGCLAYSLPAVHIVGSARQASNRGFLCMGAALLLCPPMVYVFGWDRAIPAPIEPHLRCILVWAMWAWPIATLMIGRALARYRSEYHEAALLEASPWQSFRYVALPQLRSHVALAAVVLFVLFFNDYGVPHACGLNVYATDLLGRATSSSHPADTLVPALPSLGVTILALIVAVTLWRCSPGSDQPPSTEPRTQPPTLVARGENDSPGSPASRASAARRGPTPAAQAWHRFGRGGVPAVLFLFSWGVPIAALSAKVSSTDLERALRTYWFDLLATVGVAMGGGVVVVLLAVGAWHVRWMRLAFLAWAVVWGVLPGAVVGESLIAAYNKPGLDSVYAHWPILLIGYVARFGWIGLAVTTALRRRTDPSLLDQAATDGAGTGQRLRHVILPTHWPMLAAAAGLVTVLSVAELPVTQMVRPPGYSPISLVIIEKFHRFEDGLLVALSLSLVALGLAAAVAWSWAARRQRRD